MNSSVESRVPFLDHELYEMARNISIEHHINNGNLKSILSAELNNNKKYRKEICCSSSKRVVKERFIQHC